MITETRMNEGERKLFFTKLRTEKRESKALVHVNVVFGYI